MIDRKTIGQPVLTAMVELNGREAYEALGQKIWSYPRLLPVPDTVVTYDRLVIREWFREISIFPELILVVGNDIELGGYERAKNHVLGYSLGIGLYHNSLVRECEQKGGTARDIQINRWYQYYTGGTKVQSSFLHTPDEIKDIRMLKLEMTIDRIGTWTFDIANIMFDGEYLLRTVSRLTPFKKYDIICLGPVSKPIQVPDDFRFKDGDYIKVSGKPFEELLVPVVEKRK